jgi:hypothetical protein
VAAPLPTSAETIDGHPADPAVFSQLHPDFSPPILGFAGQAAYAGAVVVDFLVH